MMEPPQNIPYIDNNEEYKPIYYWHCYYELEDYIAFGIAFIWRQKIDIHIIIGPFCFGVEKIERSNESK